MTKATDIFDALVTKVSTTLPTYTQLPESYVIEENPEQFMNKGFAVAFQSETNDEYHATNLLNLDREFSVILVNKIAATINNRTLKSTLEKALVDDGYALVKACYNDLTLGQVATVVSYVGSTGIEYVTAANGTERFISVILTFSVKYQDTF
jgi:hypothetical protein